MDTPNSQQDHEAGAQSTPVTQNPSLQITETEKTIAAIGYISFLCLLPLILKRDSNFAQFHGKQALLLAIFWFIVRFLTAFVPILNFVEIGVILWCAYTAYQGKYFKLPILGDEAEKLHF